MLNSLHFELKSSLHYGNELAKVTMFTLLKVFHQCLDKLLVVHTLWEPVSKALLHPLSAACIPRQISHMARELSLEA